MNISQRPLVVVMGTAVRLPPFPIAVLWLSLLLLNLSCVYYTLLPMSQGNTADDWRVLTNAADHGLRSGLYAGGLYQWSPLLVPLLQLLSPLGVLGWRLLHLLAAMLMPSWTLRLLVLVSWPFWFDVSVGNAVVFIVLAGAWALRGSRFASLAFLALTLLIPRPLMVPLAMWLLWQRPELRVPALVLAVLLAAATVLTGLTAEWVGTLLHSASTTQSWRAGGGGWDFNIGPSRALGVWWLAIGIPLAVWLTWKGRVGWASVAASPYVLPYYLLLLFLELVRPAPLAVHARIPQVAA